MSAIAQTENRSVGRRIINILRPSSGTAPELYDFFLYGAVSSLIAAYFFNIADPGIAFINALTTLATGFAFRLVHSLESAS